MKKVNGKCYREGSMVRFEWRFMEKSEPVVMTGTYQNAWAGAKEYFNEAVYVKETGKAYEGGKDGGITIIEVIKY